MIKRVSVVWKQLGLTNEEFRKLWLGEHARLAEQLGAREYVIDFTGSESAEQPSAIATLRFDDQAVLDRAFSDPSLVADLVRTRDQFARRVDVFIVDETVIFKSPVQRTE